MNHQKHDPAEALAQAAALEKEGLGTYLKFALATADITGKNMFIQLARDEYFHMQILEKARKEIAGGNPCPSFDRTPSAFAGLLPKLKDIKNFTRSADGINQIHALEMAEKFEEKSRDYYTEMAEKTDNPDVESIFRYMAEMEDTHYHILSAQKAALTDGGTWIELEQPGMEYLSS